MPIRRAVLLMVKGSVKELFTGTVEGATDPLVGVAKADDGERVEVVLKPTAPWQPPRGDPVPGEVLNVREVCCSLLLRKVGLAAPEPFIVTGGALAWEQMSPRYAARLAPVPHFATKLINNARECACGERLDKVATDTLRLSAEDLYAADNIVLNLDRTVEKPNLWWRSDALIPLDHGLAFAALRMKSDLVGIPAEYQKRHAIFSLLAGEVRTFDRSLAEWVSHLTTETLNELEATLPAEWVVDRQELERIEAHLSTQAVRLDELRKILRFWFGKPTRNP